MIDGPIHAALVTLMVWFVNWLFGQIGLDLGSEVVTGLATVIVGYILSLFGLSLWTRSTRSILPDGGYRPPFV